MKRQRNPERTDEPYMQWSGERENGCKNYYRTEGFRELFIIGDKEE